MRKLWEKVKGIINKKMVAVSAVGSVVASALAFAVSAEDPVTPTASTIATTMQTSFQTVVNDTMSMISAILPMALTIFGATLLIALGIKQFKKMVGKAN